MSAALDRSEAAAAWPNQSRIDALATRYRLALPERQRSPLMGELAGHRTGSSVEFQDRKDYTSGDDLRAVDWRAYARTDRLTVKLYREEVCPSVDIIVDTSLSMATTPEKRTRRLDLTYLFFLLAHKLHASVRLHDLGRRMAPLGGPFDLLASEDLAQEDPLPLLHSSAAARRGGIKIFISDLLFPFTPRDLVACFSGADRLIVLQILSAFEDDPGTGGATVRLEDAEAPRHLDLRLDADTVAKYRSRLNALRDDVGRRVRAAGGACAWVRDVDDLDEVMRRLVEAGAVTA